jgi:hypothetical protein
MVVMIFAIAMLVVVVVIGLMDIIMTFESFSVCFTGVSSIIASAGDGGTSITIGKGAK